MKQLSTLFLFIILINVFAMKAQSQRTIKNYEAQWKITDDFVKKNLPKSALAEVKQIYAQAKKDQQDAQVIKALIYITGLQQDNRENNEIISIREIEKEISSAKEPAASILNSMAASLYWQYLQANRWTLYNRTNTTAFQKDDLATWTTDDLHQKISGLFLSSVRNKKILQETNLEGYDAIITKGNMRKLRPTLYDLLLHRALEYFTNDERNITKPSYAFEIRDVQAFAPVSEFIRHKFTTRDTASIQYKALLLFQDLLTFHSLSKNTEALLDADIKRISFVKEYSVHPDKEELYFQALTQLSKKYSTESAADQVNYLLALYHEGRANQYKPYGDTSFRYERMLAKSICQQLIDRSPATEGSVNAYNLLQQINSQSLSFTIEKVNLPAQPFRMLVNYKNFNRLYLRIVKADEKLKEQLENRNDDRFWNDLLSSSFVKEWQQDIPLNEDLQIHAVEIKVDPLPAGEYIIIAGSDKSFSKKNTVAGARLVYVSSISYVANNNSFFVLDRDSGKPLNNAMVNVWQKSYDYKNSRYTKNKLTSYKTDAHGYFEVNKIKTTDQGYNYLLDISYAGERLFMDDELYGYYYDRGKANIPQKTIVTYLFTDRGLYRPGQTIYFKGIVVGKDISSQKSSVQTGYATEIFLQNANDEQVDSMTVQTNSFGSFSGKFQLPTNSLNGSFSLVMKDDEGTTNFQVEEYKRPKFYVDYEPVQGSFTVNDSISIVGNAKGYAGNAIDNAKVKYRVVREPRFIYPWLYRKWWLPPVSPLEIAHGEINTDKNGKFNIRFNAIPDRTIDQKLDPVFDYKIYADVTDINGETRSGETIVSVGYKTILLSVSLPERMPVDSLKSMMIRTENMNGHFQPAEVTVNIIRLKEEDRLIRQRYWTRPDIFIYSRAEYIRLFPNDEYDNESDPGSWQQLEKVYTRKDSVKENAAFAFNNSSLKPGYYLIEVTTKDKNGKEVNDEKYVELYDSKINRLTQPAYWWTANGKTVEPGERTAIQIATSANNVYLIKQIDRSTDEDISSVPSASLDYLRLSNEKKNIEIMAGENDRGGYSVHLFFVKNNRFFSTTHFINVPWTNKEIKIQYASFRDKTLPGSEERWKVKISGDKNEKLAAEMLASAYDASLDQFYPFQWYLPAIWPVHYSVSRWNGLQNFTAEVSVERYLSEAIQKNFRKEYDQLSLLNNFPTNNHVLIRGMKSLAVADAAPAEYAKLEGKASGVTIVNNKTLADSAIEVTKPIAPKPEAGIQIRKNFNETAFFFPDLRTDSSGAIEFSFTMPEALTRWKLQTLAHTTDLAFGLNTKEIITQKELMVQPNLPRFLREGDHVELSAKIVNLTNKEITGQAELQLFDVASNQPVDGWFQNMFPNQYFTVGAGESEAVQFPIQVPFLFNKALTWRIVAKSGNISDGEEASLAVLTNKILVTESIPLTVRGTGTKEFHFDKLLQSGNSESMQQQSLTVEYTTNPAWLAVQALPYLAEFPYECAEQTWNRYYANALASMIANASPKIKTIVEQWNLNDTSALLSNLQKNEELKSVLLQETPWVLDAKTEAQQKKNIALLFDMVRMSRELNSNFDKLKQMQTENGGFVWFNGGPDDRYITQYVTTAIGHLRKLKAIPAGQEEKLKSIIASSIPYLDKKIKEDYDQILRSKSDLKKYTPGYTQIQYLYMRSFFPDYKIAAANQKAIDYFKERALKTWTSQSKYMQGMIALFAHRAGNSAIASAILQSLKQTAVISEELGMYYKNQRSSWYWYDAPIETQALLIEAFNEAGKDIATVDQLKTWLLKNKQTNNWQTTKATAEACYALLLQGNDWISNEPEVTITLGDMKITSTTQPATEGTGYFRSVIPGEKLVPSMGNIKVKVENKSSQQTAGSWGSIYWQYLENTDQISSSATPLKLAKKLFVTENSDKGLILRPINEGDAIKVGDKITVRIELRADRDMEYVHMKDMRASGFEPLNVISAYKWQGGLGYYESTKDASTNFFFSSLRKGTYVFEYNLFAAQKGNFSNGITTIQCMYAPEFTSHSEGIRVNIE